MSRIDWFVSLYQAFKKAVPEAAQGAEHRGTGYLIERVAGEALIAHAPPLLVDLWFRAQMHFSERLTSLQDAKVMGAKLMQAQDDANFGADIGRAMMASHAVGSFDILPQTAGQLISRYKASLLQSAEEKMSSHDVAAFFEAEAYLADVKKLDAISNRQAVSQIVSPWSQGMLHWIAEPPLSKASSVTFFLNRFEELLQYSPDFIRRAIDENFSGKALHEVDAIAEVRGLLAKRTSASADDAGRIMDGKMKTELTSLLEEYRQTLDATSNALSEERLRFPNDIDIRDCQKQLLREREVSKSIEAVQLLEAELAATQGRRRSDLQLDSSVRAVIGDLNVGERHVIGGQSPVEISLSLG